MTAPLAPGTRVFAQTQQPASNPVLSTGVWFVAGATQRGPVGRPIALQSMADYAAVCGARTPATAMLYDSLELFFRDGGSQAIVSRRVGAAAAVAALILKDQGSSGGSNTLQIAANSPGVWGNGLAVAVAVSGSGFVVTVSYGGVVVETSPTLASPADAVNWSSRSAYVKITDQGSATAAPTNNPATLSATSLAGGADDAATVTDATLTADLDVLTTDYGPGQVSVPGATTDLAHQIVLAHAQKRNRIALLDGLDTPVAATLIASAAAASANQTAADAPTRGGIFAPWVRIPGVPASGPVPTALRTVPPSAVAAAGCARVDAGGNPNVPPAGGAGISPYALDVTQVYRESDRAALNAAGVNLLRYFNNYGQVKLYGFRTLSPDPLHTQMNWARLDMAIFNAAKKVGEDIAEFGQIDARGVVFVNFQGALVGALTQFWTNGALYGEAASDAFAVDVGPDVNTVQTKAAGQINAAIAIKRAPVGEFVNIGVVSVSLATPL